jgi:hypothetical protein
MKRRQTNLTIFCQYLQSISGRGYVASASVSASIPAFAAISGLCGSLHDALDSRAPLA